MLYDFTIELVDDYREYTVSWKVENGIVFQ